MRLQPGTVIGDRYRLTEPIASGGMGTVWKAEDTTLGRAVAIKLLKPELSGDPTFLARFRGEARHSGRLNHPNIAAVYDYGETPGSSGLVQAYLVMELVPGQPLSQILADEDRLAPDRVLRIVRQVGSGLAAAHAAGIVHRDIKPGNLILTPDGQVKITDFGISRAVNAVPLTATGTVMGTARYLSPEQATGESLSPASDIYSLGVVAYEALAGRPPFDAEGQVAQAMAHVHDDPRPLPGDVPAPVRALVMQMLAKSPAERPADGDTLVRDVDAAARGDLPVDPTAAMGTRPGQEPPDTGATQVLPPRGAPGDMTSTRVMPGGWQTGSAGATSRDPGRAEAGTEVYPAAAGGTAAYPQTGGAGYPPAAASAPPANGATGSAPVAGPPGRKRRRMTGPLIALILLVAFIALGAVFGNFFQGGGEPAPTTVTETFTPSPTETSQTETQTQTQTDTATDTNTDTGTNTQTDPSPTDNTTTQEPTQPEPTQPDTNPEPDPGTEPQNEGDGAQGDGSQGDGALGEGAAQGQAEGNPGAGTSEGGS